MLSIYSGNLIGSEKENFKRKLIMNMVQYIIYHKYKNMIDKTKHMF